MITQKYDVASYFSLFPRNEQCEGCQVLIKKWAEQNFVIASADPDFNIFSILSLFAPTFSLFRSH